MDNQEMEQQLEEMRRSRKSMESQHKEKSKRNEELKAYLRKLRDDQQRLSERAESLKAEKAKHQRALEEKTEKMLRSRQEIEKLKPYVMQSPEAIQASITELSDNLNRDKGHIDMLERRTRALQTSTDTFGVVANDVQSCIKVLEEVSVELQKEEEETARAIRNRDALSDRSNNVREVERHEGMLQRQLSRWNERTDTLRKGSEEKTLAAKERMGELRDVHRRLAEEKAEKSKDMERRRVRIEQTEKKVRQIPVLQVGFG